MSYAVTPGLHFVWRTERPFPGRPHRSSIFCFLDAEWTLQISYEVSEYWIELQKMTAWNDFHAFDVTTWIEVQRYKSTPIHCVRQTVSSANQYVWSTLDTNILEEIREFEFTREFTIVCMLHAVSPSGLRKEIKNQSIQASLEFPADLEDLSVDLGNLLEKGAMPDVQLKCGDSFFPAHRAVLAARSKVFSAMFRSNMSESQTGIVDVSDDPKILELFLKYVYCGRIPDTYQDLLSALYTTADKYAVLGLKKACSNCMTGSLTEENCIGFLVLADAHSDEEFKNVVVHFITENKQVLSSETWSRFVKEHPTLANEIFQKCVAKWFSE